MPSDIFARILSPRLPANAIGIEKGSAAV